MASAKRTKAVSPTSAEIEAHLDQIASRHPEVVQVEEVAKTEEGRPILAATVTDERSDPQDKQHVLVTSGQHGNEESGRMVAMALLDWLVTPAAAETRRKQKIVILPNVNPDGAEHDTHLTATGRRPNADHQLTGATCPEGIAVEKVAYALQPELYVDLHARGFAGCSYDMVLYPWARPYTEDDNLLHAIAAEMVRAGEREGIPQVTHPLSWPGWGGNDMSDASTTMFAYRNFKSMVFLTENSESNEHAYPAKDRARSGLAKVQVLLAHGNRRHPSLGWPGYPCMLVTGLFGLGVAAVGRTAAERRASRIAAWEQIHTFRGLSYDLPEKPTEKNIKVGYEGAPLEAVGIQLRKRGRLRLRSVTFDGKRMKPGPVGGYSIWQDNCSTFVLVALKGLRSGDHRLDVRFA